MSPKTKKKIKSRLTPEQIRPLIENFERQGQSIVNLQAAPRWSQNPIVIIWISKQYYEFQSEKDTKSRLTPEQIRPPIENFERQGQSIKDFCQRYGISEVTLYNWRKKYGIKPDIDNAGFIEIIPAVASCEPITEKLFAQVRGINIYQPVSADYLKSLLA